MRKTVFAMMLTAMLFFADAPRSFANEGASCSVASLQGTYGFTAGIIVLPLTPRAVVGRFSFGGKGNWSNSLTMNDAGTIRKLNDFGTYIVTPDCTGTLYPQTGAKGTIEIVLVDGGNEFYELRTDPSSIVFLVNAAKKQHNGNGPGN